MKKRYLIIVFLLIGLFMVSMISNSNEGYNMTKSYMNYESIISTLESDYSEYYSGVFFDSRGILVFLLVDSVPDDVSKKIVDNGYSVRKVKYSLIELYQALEDLSLYEHSSLLSSSVVQEKNSIVLVVSSDKSTIEKAIREITDFQNIKIIERKDLQNTFNF